MEILGVIVVVAVVVAAIRGVLPPPQNAHSFEHEAYRNRMQERQARRKKKEADHNWAMHQKKMRDWDKMREEQMTPSERLKRQAYLAQLEEENKRKREAQKEQRTQPDEN